MSFSIDDYSNYNVYLPKNKTTSYNTPLPSNRHRIGPNLIYRDVDRTNTHKIHVCLCSRHFLNQSLSLSLSLSPKLSSLCTFFLFHFLTHTHTQFHCHTHKLKLKHLLSLSLSLSLTKWANLAFEDEDHRQAATAGDIRGEFFLQNPKRFSGLRSSVPQA